VIAVTHGVEEAKLLTPFPHSDLIRVEDIGEIIGSITLARVDIIAPREIGWAV
jgi:hypothetical protein